MIMRFLTVHLIFALPAMGQKLEENLTILKDQKSYGEIQKYLLLVHHIAVFHDMN